MKVLIQRVLKASCVVEGETTGEIQKGLVVFAGFTKDDTREDLQYIFKKLVNLRIFENDEGKIHYSVKDLDYSILLIPQFTLYANTKKGYRPDFFIAMPPAEAKNYFNDFIDMIKRESSVKVETGVFGADMKILALNDGPFSIIIDSKDR